MKEIKTAGYEQAEWEKICKEAGLWDNIKGVGKGMMDLGGGVIGLVKNLLKAGVSGAEIAKALLDVFGNILEMPFNAIPPAPTAAPTAAPSEGAGQEANYGTNANGLNRGM